MLNLLDGYSINDLYFNLIIVISVIFLYYNSIDGNFIWDDRAAIISNSDVKGLTTLKQLFSHDFWGQDITLFDSHKSYRPLTVLTFRMDHYFHGLSADGYHVSNIIIYALACLAMYKLALQWLNKPAARLAALIFIFHPVHVESVASIVGRADCLSGLFYFASMIMYKHALGIKGGMSYVYTALSFALGICSSLAKEIGITVFASLVVMEYIENLYEGIYHDRHFRNVKDISLIPSNQIQYDLSRNRHGYFSKQSFEIHFQILIRSISSTLTTMKSLLKIVAIVVTIFVFFRFRFALHGETVVYKWTILENHIDIIPDSGIRALSYAQSHFWYGMKLLYPKYLCFDYGYACIPVITSLVDFRNLYPAFMYLLFFGSIYYGIFSLNIRLLVGLAFFLLPLIPALNIFIPVGTLLAERLLFIPSMGFCLVVAEVIMEVITHIFILPSLAPLTSVQTIDGINPVLGKKYTSYWHRYDHRLDQTFEKLEDKILGTVDSIILALTPVEQEPEQENSYADEHSDSSPTNASQNQKKKAGVRFNFNNPPKKKKPSNHRAATATSPKVGTDGSPAISPTNASLVLSSEDDADHHANSKKSSVLEQIRKRRFEYSFLQLFFLYPLIYLSTLRIISRNIDWKTELNIYTSSLAVCPNSLKALSNYAMLVTAAGEPEKGLEAALKSIEVYDDNPAGMINAGVAYQRLENFLPAIELYEAASQSDTSSKAFGYLASIIYAWKNKVANPYFRYYLADIALNWVDTSLAHGFAPPAILHLGGSISMDLQRTELAVEYYKVALQKAKELIAMRGGSKDVPVEDDIQIAYAYNQLGNCYYTLQRYAESVAYYEEGLSIDPYNIPLISNSAIVYRETKQFEKARSILNRGLEITKGSSSLALMNNLGLLEMEIGNTETAYQLFEKASQIIGQYKLGGGNLVDKDDAGVDYRLDATQGNLEAVIAGNLEDARKAILAKRG